MWQRQCGLEDAQVFHLSSGVNLGNRVERYRQEVVWPSGVVRIEESLPISSREMGQGRKTERGAV